MRRCVFPRLPVLMSVLFVLLGAATACLGDGAAFDLAGPKVDVHVQRNGLTLPIAEVPNLLPGDRLWIHPDLPESQSAHYVLIVAFLRGATNPPPPDWFRRVETWNHEVREEGVFVVVPAEAEQALLFLAPETGGDFTTLRKSVHDRPGAFVRAGQDLQQASWDRMRLDAYLAQVKAISPNDPKVLKEKTELAARSLGIHVDQQCFDKPTEQQAPCLVQHTDGLVLDDSNAQSVVNQMANGSAADMMNQLSYAPMAGAGALSPYVGAIVDMAKILSSMHTAKYQYIPALALPQKEQGDTLNLRLNVPPSFRDPKSVIVIALPPVGPSHLPQMHSAEPAQAAASTAAQAPATNQAPAYCATKPDLTFSAEGAPLVFATAMAHDLTLHLETKAKLADSGSQHPELVEVSSIPLSKPAESGIDIPVEANPADGGFVLTKPLPTLPEAEVVAELRGKWGFDSWEGLKFHLRSPREGGWIVPASDRNALITGREDSLHIEGESTLCVEEVEATLPKSSGQASEPKPVKVGWKSTKPELLDVTVPLKEAAPGTVTMAIRQYGLAKPEELPLKAYAEAASIEHLTLSAGDKVAELKGKRLDEVDSADLAGISFTPTALNRVQDFDQLELSATGVTDTLQPGNSYSAKVTLRDGRMLHVPATVSAPRPQVDLLSKGVQHEDSEGDPGSQLPVHLGSPNDLPLQRRLVFFLRSRVPRAFPRTEKVELAAVDGSFQTTLSLTDGSLMLEDSHTAVAALDPLARFGASAFGPIHLRAVTADGITGDWVPLGTLVRLPGFTAGPASKDLRCPRNPAKPCQLSGNNLFLITEVATTPDMANAVEVPAEFTGSAVTIPNIARSGGANGGNGTLYLRLRDDPDTVQTLNLPISSPVSSVTPAATDSAVTANPAAVAAGKQDTATPVAPADATVSDPKPETKNDSASDPAQTPSPNL
ncbi:hypothetical protein [Acidicapsa acidisoli]|uniref:hypothetical protein n=1 Tax=Acidicapsa acidisoli TaxID=1615681 RepID=UPI0021DFE12C|nr:hypothetical protein [Acidicapsa acidisoli]